MGSPLLWAPRKARGEAEVHEFVDGEFSVRIALRPKSLLLAMRQDDLANELIEQYLTGSETSPPEPFPAIGGEIVEVSAALFRIVAGVAVCQAPVDGVHVYTPEELVAIAARSELIFTSILSAMPKGAGEDDEAKKNDGKPEGDGSSGNASS